MNDETRLAGWQGMNGIQLRFAANLISTLAIFPLLFSLTLFEFARDPLTRSLLIFSIVMSVLLTCLGIWCAIKKVYGLPATQAEPDSVSESELKGRHAAEPQQRAWPFLKLQIAALAASVGSLTLAFVMILLSL